MKRARSRQRANSGKKKTIGRRIRTGARYARLGARAIMRQKRVELAELRSRAFERSVEKLENDPKAVALFRERRLKEINKAIDEKVQQQHAVVEELRKLGSNESRSFRLPKAGKPKHQWTKSEAAASKRQARLVRKDENLTHEIKFLKAEISLLRHLS